MNRSHIAAMIICVSAAYRADCSEPINWKALPQEQAIEKLRSLKVEKASFPKETLEERIKKLQVYAAPFGLKVSLEPGTNKNRELYAFELPPGPFVLLLKYTCGNYNLASRLTNGGIVFFDKQILKAEK